jgi:diguanylate cyclase (GGDEF)-like protein
VPSSQDQTSLSPLAPRHDGGLGPLSRAGVTAIAFLVILCLALGDLLTGTDVSFTLLYLAPIAFGTWFVGLEAGVALSMVAAIASVTSDLYAREGPPLPSAVMAWNLVVQLGVYLAQVLLLAGFRARLEGEQQLARTDALTQVANRRAFIEAAELELERARRSGRPLTLAYVDCDDFKQINDTLGHAEGDALLVTVGQTLRGSTRAVDAVARLGGDEFGLLLPETDGPTAQALLLRLRDTLQQAMDDHHWPVGFSCGAATFATPAASVDEMMARADELMYQAKRSAKGSMRLAVVGEVAPLPPEPAHTPTPGPYGGA